MCTQKITRNAAKIENNEQIWYLGHTDFDVFFRNFVSPRLTKIICFQDDSIFSCMFKAFLVIIKRYPGPDFDKNFEVPEIIQKVLEYDRGP